MEKIKDVPLIKKIYNALKVYGKEVNEARAIPDVYDGLKPVQRKVLWAMHKLNLDSPTKLVKTARLVGDVLGKYHPHGDKSVQDAIAILVNQNISPIYGEGNWGSIAGDSPAAMRYTLVRLSEFGRQFFDPYYLPVLDLVPNYDGSEKEPVRLFPSLPQVLLNGGSGIGVGVTVDLPSYTKKSVITTLIDAATRGGATPESCYSLLEFVSQSNSIVRKKSQRTALLEFYKTGQGSIKHESRLAITKEGIVLTGVAPFQGTSAYMKKIFAVGDLQEVANVQDQSSQWELKIVYALKRGVSAEAVLPKLEKSLTSIKHYKINITRRKLIEKNGWRSAHSEFAASSVPEIINDWLKERVELEVKATTWHLAQLQQQIRRNEVLRLACKFRDFIFSLAKSTKTDEQIKSDIEKKLNCSKEEAAFIFDMKWRQLRDLEDAQIEKRMQEQEKQKKSWEYRVKNPGKYVVAQLEKML